MNYKVILDSIEESDWERHAGGFADYSIYQTWAYQRVRGEMDRQEVSRAVVTECNGQAVTMCQMRIKCFKPLGLKIGYVQWGPLFRRLDGTNEFTGKALQCLVKAYLGSRVNVLRVVPNAEANHIGCEFAAMLESAGFEYVKSVRPYFTMTLSVDGSEEEIRSRLHRSWRRGLNKAEQNGLEIKEGPDSEYLELLEKMYVEAKKRKGFRGLNPREFIRTQELLPAEEKMNAITAYHNGRVVTVHVSSHLGDTAVGTLAASNEEGFRYGSSYLVWWKTFLAAKRAGMKRYDLGGIDPKDNFEVYQFKQRMGARQCQYIGAYEICTNSVVKDIWHLAERTYRLVKKEQ